MTLYAGIDVPGRQRDFDIALVDATNGVLSLVATARRRTPGQVVNFLATHHPKVVAVDAPIDSAKPGKRSRACEKALRASVCGIRYTPDTTTMQASPKYYDWIFNGHDLYRALSGGAGWEVIECFPTASWTRLHGRRGNVSRATWSSQALGRLRISCVPSRHNQDVRDAIVAAYTAYLYDNGPRGRANHPFWPIVIP